MSEVRVFLSHSSKDKPFVRKLAQSLASLGVAPWLDEVEIKPGDSLFGKIGTGLAASDYVFAIISEHSITSRWVAEELHSMMNAQVSSGTVRVIPIKLDGTAMPWFLAEKKYLDFRQWQSPDAYRAAFDALTEGFGWVPSARCRKTGIEFVKVEEGAFLFGPEKSWQHLPTFWISRFVLTTANLVPYLNEAESAAGYRFFGHSQHVRQQLQDGRGMYPAQYVPIGVGSGFAHWAGFQLPTEKQWEKAARGTDGRTYPWGDEWDAARCNSGKAWRGDHFVPVDAHPEGRSPYGCFNMAGNVVEITSTMIADNENDTHFAGKGGWCVGTPLSVVTHGHSSCSDFGEYPHYGYRFVVAEVTEAAFIL